MRRLLALLLAASLCQAATPPSQDRSGPPPARIFAGKFVAPESATVRPRIGGQVLKVAVKEGDLVKKGQMLFQLDDALPRAQLARAEARAQSSQATYRRAQSDLARARMAGAGASLEEKMRLADQLVEQAALVKLSQAEVAIARLKVEMAQVRSPIDGRAGRVLAGIGEAVRENETRLLTIEGLGKPAVMLEVGERDLLGVFAPMALKPAGDDARKVIVTTAASKRLVGRVVSVEGRLDPETRAARVRVEVEGEDIGLAPGFSAKVELPAVKPPTPPRP